MKFLSGFPATFSRTLQALDLAHLVALVRVLTFWTAGLFGLVLLAWLFSLSMPWLAHVPAAIQIACAGILVLSLSLLRVMFRERAQAVQTMHDFVVGLENLDVLTRSRKHLGLSHEAMDIARRRGRSFRGQSRAWWARLEQSFELYSNAGREGWFVTQPVQDSLPFEAVTGSLYHASFHQAVPGILTASGLLCTFAAILLGLGGVVYNSADPSHPVTGIDTLINGLSGKFVTSIVALTMSIIFLYCEKRICERSIAEAHENMLNRCRELFPYLSQTRILLDIQMELERHSASRASMSAEQG